MKILIEVDSSKENDTYMEFDLDTMYCKTKNNGVVDYEKFTHKHIATVLFELAEAFLKKGG